MKKSTRLIVIVAVVLATWAVYLVLRKDNSSFREELRNFSVADTASISKVFLADKNNNKILLERKGPAEWTLNGKETARQGGINQLLNTILHLSVQSRVPKSHFNLVIKDLASSAIKCEIYTKDPAKPFKTYYVGSSTQDMTGTYMMLEGSSVPFVMEIPGFNGYLTSRYTVQLNDWRDRIVFAEDPAALTSVRIVYPHDPANSFRIERRDGKLRLFPAAGEQAMPLADTTALLNYIDFFRLLPFEDWEKKTDAAFLDSLARSTPLAVITVTGPSGTTEAVLHPMPITKNSLSQMDEKGNPLPYDVDRMHAFIKGGKELVIIQYFSFGKVLRKLSDFRPVTKRQG